MVFHHFIPLYMCRSEGCQYLNWWLQETLQFTINSIVGEELSNFFEVANLVISGARLLLLWLGPHTVVQKFVSIGTENIVLLS